MFLPLPALWLDSVLKQHSEFFVHAHQDEQPLCAITIWDNLDV